MRLDRACNANREAMLIALGEEQLQVARIGDVAGFEQHRRHVGRLEHGEPGEAVIGGLEVDALIGELVLEQIGEARRGVHRLALRQVDQDR